MDLNFVIVLLFYLLVGCWMFRAGLKQQGGKEEYKIYLRDEAGFKNPDGGYWTCFIIFELFWPAFVIGAVIDYLKEKRNEG